MIQIEKLTKAYYQGETEVRALDEVSLEVEAGTFLSIMGPSGSGKSSLLQLLGGLDTPTNGEIRLDGRPISHMSDDEITVFRRQKIGFVFQFFNLLPTLTAGENVALPLLLDGKRWQDVRERVERQLEFVGLGHRIGHRATALSGGELQRVAVARALVTDPVLLLADEPTGNLDTRTGTDVLGLMKQANERLGQTVVMVTHDPKAAAYGDRLITLKDGRIVSDERPSPAATVAAGWR